MTEHVQTEDQPSGEEYSCLPFPWFIAEAEKRGVTREQILDGVPYSIDHLSDRTARIDWASACRLFSNMARKIDDAGFIDIGMSGIQSSVHRYVFVIARLLFTTREFYDWMMLEAGSDYLRCIRTNVVDLTENRLRVEIVFDEGYEANRVFLLIVQGLMIMVPVVLGGPRAQVKAEFSERGAVYHVEYQEAGGALSWLRRAGQWLWSARAGARELRDAHDQLQSSFHRLEEEKARRVTAEEALLTIRDQERDRIRRDLHDGVGQKLTGLGLIAKSLTTKLERRGLGASQEADALKRNCERLLDELRVAVQALEPRRVPRDALREALHRLSYQCREDWGVACVIQIPENLAAPNDDWATDVCLVAEDALRFTADQGPFGQILLYMEQSADDLLFRITANRSDDVLGTKAPNGLGLRILERRIVSLGGTLTPGARNEDGVIVAGTVPMPN